MDLKNKRSQTVAFCLGILLTGALVQLAGSLRGDRLVFPGVGQILSVFVRLLGEGSTWLRIGVTLLHLAEALALSALLGLLIGLAEGFSPFIRNLLKPLMITLRSLPMIVLVILIMVLAHYSAVPLIATRDDLYAFAAGDPACPLREGWRYEVCGRTLDGLLAGEVGLTVKDGRVETL